eukprot:9958220-Prorocentrum_lima.AAC.1
MSIHTPHLSGSGFAAATPLPTSLPPGDGDRSSRLDRGSTRSSSPPRLDDGGLISEAVETFIG